MIQINKRIIVVCILLSIITFGIYGIYWLYLLVKNTRSIQKNTTSCTGEMLCLMFVPFYSLYWWYTRGEKVKQEFSQHNYASTGNGIVYLILAIFGLSIVSMAIMQSDFNSLKSETHSEQRSARKMLELSHIYKTFNQGTIDEKVLFSDFNITVNDGDFVGVIGSNGSGKTTMLNVISGDMPIDSGSILLDGKELNKLKNFKRAQRIGRVFQNPAMGTCPSMTIWENLSIADNKGKNFGLSFGLNRQRKDFYRSQLELLGMGLENRLSTLAGSLSGGQRQALALIMATMNRPDLLLLDEHTAALDPKSSDTVMMLTDKIVHEKNITTIMVTHNLRHAVEHGTRTVMMHNGEAIMDVSGAEKDNKTINDYLTVFNEISIECGN